jgi:multiple sugar transport system permease protein
MIQWLDTPIVNLFNVVSITRMWPLVAVASLYLAWTAQRKRHSALLWFGIGLGGYILVSEVTRALIPNAVVQIAPGQRPTASYTLWSTPAFRADLGLVILLVVLAAMLVKLVGRLMRYVSEPVPSEPGDRLLPPRPWQLRASVVGSAICLLLPLIIWIWTALWIVFVGDYTHLALPLFEFVALAIVSGVLTYRLTKARRRIALAVLAVLVILAQLWYNASLPSVSMFESNGSFPFYLSLIPVLVGVLVAQAALGTLSRRSYVLLGWRLGLLMWGLSFVGWLVRFMGFFSYDPSYAFDLSSLVQSPVRFLVALSDLYYNVIPRSIPEAQNIANMERWESALALGVGVLTWAWVLVHVQWQIPVLAQRRTVGDYVRQISGIQLTLRQRRYVLAYVLILPAVALRTFTTFYPFVQTVILSLQKYNPAFPPRRYIALVNFHNLSNDLVVRESLTFTLEFVFVSTFFQVALGLAIAHLLNANFRLRGLARTISLIPWAVPMVVAAIGFRWIFDTQFGMIPDLLQRLFGLHIKWLINPRDAQIAVIIVNVWKSTPFAALLLLAGLQGISQDLYEAAKVDGANWFDALRFITVPMVMPIIVTITMFMLVWQLALFDLPFAMTGGGPGFSTTVVAQKIYLEINSLNYSYASAISIALVIVVSVIGGVGLYTLRRVEVST